ncbi:hypothetical protein ACSBR2_023319 [Camellia fascicularis]
MGEGKKQMPKSPCSLYAGDAKHEDHWTIMDGEDDDTYTTTTSSTSSFEDPTVSNGSSSSDMADDVSSSSTSNLSSSSCSTEPLYDLSELMAQLPIKRGLSKFYKGKSQSYASLSMVTSIEDLPKKETPFRRKLMKASKSYGGGLDSYKSYTLPKPTISKKASRGSSSSLSLLSFPTRRGSFVSSCSSPLNPVQENWGC